MGRGYKVEQVPGKVTAFKTTPSTANDNNMRFQFTAFFFAALVAGVYAEVEESTKQTVELT